MQLINEPRTTFPQALHAILIAELADVDGWSTLITVVSTAGHRDLAERFRAAAETEERHLEDVRTWMARLTQAELSAG